MTRLHTGATRIRNVTLGARFAIPDGFVFATSGPVDTEQVYKRMVFSDIVDDRFHWRWEASPDGAAWTARWSIDYRRSESAAD